MTPKLHTPPVRAQHCAAPVDLLQLDWPEILTWDHDDVVRFTLVAELIHRLAAGRTGTIRLLDVGGSGRQRWASLLDRSRVSVVRCDVEPVGNGTDYVLRKKGRPMCFVEETFDVVVALDVLERLPAATRAGFLADSFRVSRAGAIWTCPAGRPDLTPAEAAILAGKVPNVEPTSRDELRENLQALDAPFAIFANEPLGHWLALIVVEDTMRRHDVPVPVRSRINEQLGTAYPVGEVPYRLVAVAARDFAATVALEPLSSDSSGLLLEGPTGQGGPSC